jgi:hypothetical protein
VLIDSIREIPKLSLNRHSAPPAGGTA